MFNISKTIRKKKRNGSFGISGEPVETGSPAFMSIYQFFDFSAIIFRHKIRNPVAAQQVLTNKKPRFRQNCPENEVFQMCLCNTLDAHLPDCPKAKKRTKPR